MTGPTGPTAIGGFFTAQNATGTTGATGGGGTPVYLWSSDSAFGIYYGQDAPTFSARKGSLYIATGATGTSTRMYINTNGTTGWTNFTTAA